MNGSRMHPSPRRDHHGPGVVAWGPCRCGAGTLQWFGTRVLAETGEVKQCPLGAIRELMGELGANPAALATVPK